MNLVNYHRLVINLLRPVPCPYTLIRLGGCVDGAYLIPADLDGIKSCFSPGVCNSKEFEDELSHKFKIKCHLCDYSSTPDQLATPLVDGLQTFEKLWLDIDDSDISISLGNWVKKHAPSKGDDLMLQMDIEGAEYRNIFLTSLSTLSRFRIVVIEIHRLDKLEQGEFTFNLFTRISLAWHHLLPALKPLGRLPILGQCLTFFSRKLEPFLLAPILHKLSLTHRCIHAHPNNCLGEFIDSRSGMNISRVIELSFLRKDRFHGSPENYFSPKLPHPLDIKSNISTKPEIVLNQYWLKPFRS